MFHSISLVTQSIENPEQLPFFKPTNAVVQYGCLPQQMKTQVLYFSAFKPYISPIPICFPCYTLALKILCVLDSILIVAVAASVERAGVYMGVHM